MPITATITASPSSPNHGDTVTFTYHVSGNDPVAPVSQPVTGDVTVGGLDLQVSTTVSLPGTPALPEVYSTPVTAGLTPVATADPHVFTALVP